MPTGDYNDGHDAGERDSHEGTRETNEDRSQDYQDGYNDGHNGDNTGDKKSNKSAKALPDWCDATICDPPPPDISSGITFDNFDQFSKFNSLPFNMSNSREECMSALKQAGLDNSLDALLKNNAKGCRPVRVRYCYTGGSGRIECVTTTVYQCD